MRMYRKQCMQNKKSFKEKTLSIEWPKESKTGFAFITQTEFFNPLCQGYLT